MPGDRLSTGSASSATVSPSCRQDRDAREAGSAVDVGERRARRAGDLAHAGVTAELQDVLVHLPQTGRADRLAVGEAAAVGVHRQRTADLGGTFGDEALLLAVRAQPGLGEV